jgi:queuine tRNA-ribosyltransferase
MPDKMFKIESKEGNARTGKLKLANAEVKTPFFMPVATKATAKFVDTKDLEKSNVQCVISNSLILDLMVGNENIAKRGGIHKFMNFNGGVFTDSGGFQMYSEHMLIETKKFGVAFRDPRNGKRFFCSPEKSMEIQQKIGADVAMCLDDMPMYGASKKRLEESMQKTYEWAKRCKQEHDTLNKKKKKGKQLLFGICQGGTYKDLREKSAEMISSIDFDGLAFGGLALGEPIGKMFDAVKAGMKKMPEQKPKYLMGVGVPLQIIDAVSMGVDCFDSTYPTQIARHDYLLTMKGKIEINKSKFADDKNPIEEGCDCHACKNYSRSYLHFLSKTKEPAGYRLRTIHNIRFMTRLMAEIRKAIKGNRLLKFRKEMEKGYGDK